MPRLGRPKAPMYRCEDCKQMTAAGAPQHRVVIAMRHCLYPWPKPRTPELEEKLKRKPPPEGWEIVRELKLCASCASAHQPNEAGVSSKARMIGPEKRVVSHLSRSSPSTQ